MTPAISAGPQSTPAASIPSGGGGQCADDSRGDGADVGRVTISADAWLVRRTVRGFETVPLRFVPLSHCAGDSRA